MMKRILLSLLCLMVLLPTAALAMDQSAVPPKFPIPWGASAGSNYIRSIPTPSQIGLQNCAASLTDGFPPLTFVPSIAGGCPPFGVDFNGILKQLSQWSQWSGAGAYPLYDSAFSSSIGGYPSGATLANASTPGCFWVSTTDNNASDPDIGGGNWSSSCPGGGVGGTSTGTANVQVVSTTPFVLRAGAVITFTSNFSNSGLLTVNANATGAKSVYRHSQLGATASVGGEVSAGQLVTLEYDGTEWQCMSCGIVRVGGSEDYFGSSAPNGTLFEDGSCVSQTSYADLFSITGSAYGSCSAGNFALPDTRSRVIAGQDTQGSQGAAGRLTTGGSGCAGSTIGTACGGQNVTLGQVNLPTIDLTGFSLTAAAQVITTSVRTNVPVSLSGGTFEIPINGQGNAVTTTLDSAASSNVSGTIPLGGSNNPTTTVQPTLIATKIIKF